ncbi:MAG: nicotinate-nucleotide--dimethylbenzimidazole phosphoribosyltransferase, partial [Tannerellaceae bacterium]
SAFITAYEMQPDILDNTLFSHSSNEKGHVLMLKYLKGDPILQLDLRLGEGTGVALAYPIIQSALIFLNEMASFETAAVTQVDK